MASSFDRAVSKDAGENKHTKKDTEQRLDKNHPKAVNLVFTRAFGSRSDDSHAERPGSPECLSGHTESITRIRQQ